MKIGLLAILVLSILGAIYFIFKGTKTKIKKKETKEFVHGSFLVRLTLTTSKTININYGYVDQSTVYYEVFYKNNPVVFPGRLESNTGLPFLWQVYILEGAPYPSFIAGSQSLYLIYEKDSKVIITPISEQSSDFASIQLLDSQQGQPGEFKEVYMQSELCDTLKRIEGGQYLLISEHNVLDISTENIVSFNTQNNSVQNYSFPSPKGALAFSPDHKNIVFRGEFQSWSVENDKIPDSDNALIVYNYISDSAYALIFDDTELRVGDVQDLNLEWFNTYFEWQKHSSGELILVRRKLEKLMPWIGKYDPKDNYYYLFPVKSEMLTEFLDFVLKQLKWPKENIVLDETKEYSGRTLEISDGRLKFDINLRLDDQKISFSKNLYLEKSPEHEEIVKRISEAFNSELKSGKYQEHFDRKMSQTKKILGIK